MGKLYILDLTKRSGGMDITKARRGHHRDRGPSLLDVSAWNASPGGLKHPKGADGRWVDGHPSVGALGDMPDFAHHFSDADLIGARKQAQSLLSAIDREERHRAGLEGEIYETSQGPRRFRNSEEASAWMHETGRDLPVFHGDSRVKNPAKPLTATGVKKPAKPVPQDVLDDLAAVHKRPMPGDRARLEASLGKLTIAQIKDAGEASGVERRLITGTKKEQIETVVRMAVGALQHEVITHDNYDSVFMGLEANAKARALQTEFERRKKLAVERGDREEYAALVAGYGIAGKGPGLPPEKNKAEVDHAAKVKAEGKPLKATSAKAKPNDGSALTNSWMDGTFAADIDAVIKNPKAGSDALLTAQLGRLKVSELGELAAKHNVKLVGRTKAEKIQGFVKVTVGGKIMGQSLFPSQQSADTPKLGTANLDRLAGGPIKPGEFGPGSGAPNDRRYTRDMPDALVHDIERDIRTAHLAAVSKPGRNEWSFLSEWRGPLDERYGRANVDAVFVDLASGGSPDSGFVLTPESNQKTLTPADRAASVRMGNQDNHLLSLRGSHNPAEPKLVPKAPPLARLEGGGPKA